MIDRYCKLEKIVFTSGLFRKEIVFVYEGSLGYKVKYLGELTVEKNSLIGQEKGKGGREEGNVVSRIAECHAL